MAKRFKLKFTIPSFQLCRSKDLSSFPGNPVVPAIYRLSPVNPKAHDIGYPYLPAPPPSTPEFRGSKVSSKLVSFGHGCQMCRGNEEKKQVREEKKQVKALTARGRKSTSSVPSRRIDDVASDKLNGHDDEDESQSLISCTASFSDEFCNEEAVVSYSHHEPEKEFVSKHRRKVSSVKKVQRLRFQALENHRREPAEKEQVKKKTKTTVVSTRRSTVEGKVRESFTVVKKSKDPYEDFKKSMLEMIREMEMSEAGDLEQLLQCFLALNSRSYHEVIVRAFMEIWQQMFVLKPASTENLRTDVETSADKGL